MAAPLPVLDSRPWAWDRREPSAALHVTYRNEREVALVDRIPAENVLGARPICPDGALGTFVPNPNTAQVR